MSLVSITSLTLQKSKKEEKKKKVGKDQTQAEPFCLVKTSMGTLNVSQSDHQHQFILVRIVAAALNHRDLWILSNKYPNITVGSVLGSDGSGFEVNSGRCVILNPSCNWQSSPHAPENPKDYGILGLLPHPGTFSTHILIHKDHVFPKPQHLNFDQAAALPLAGLTAWCAVVSRARVDRASVVLVTGIGGGGKYMGHRPRTTHNLLLTVHQVALFALQFCIALGAKVVVTSSSQDKINRAKDLGAMGVVNYRDEGWQKNCT